MRALLDTDILLDVALRRAKFFANSAAVLQWAESEPGQAAVAWHSLSNISYLLRPDARPFIRDLLAFVEVPGAGTDAAKQAVEFPMKDFEDALQAAAALAFRASYIVTRNATHYRRSPVPAISPVEFVAAVRRSSV
ncbi:MAG: PIN domain-containing protein [Candidatus Rokubacteria bacterium]|nr:PIN domain-containing protein [Candidatus Rokubacteria bacterium]